ncbi:hypothetical protein GCM10022232_46170 [Streptomyces plumbiresistens]|uniref:Uncharacterized protein n=1 Tax=Streptomyces plumbiresistens TaxID=511811 RepID=A0ABP7RU97_9ACTN
MTVSAPTTFTGGFEKVTLRIFGATVSMLNMLCCVTGSSGAEVFEWGLGWEGVCGSA